MTDHTMTEQPQQGRFGSAAVNVIWALGLLMVGVVAIFSVVYLAIYAHDVLVGMSARRVLWVAGAVLAAGAVWALVIWNRGPFRSHALLVGLAAIAITRLLDIALVGAPLISDFARYDGLAVQIAHNGPMLALVPTGYPTALAVVYAVFGSNPVNGQLLNCVIALLTGAMVFDITRRLWGDRPAAWALWLFALAPSQILMTGVLAAEAPYGLLVTAAIWISLKLGSRPLLAAVCIGCLLAASQYVRATTPVLLPAFMLIPFLAPAARLKPAAILAGVMAVVFLVCLLPVVAWNEQTRGELSISPSYYGGWSLLVGTDSASGGQYDDSLIPQVQGTPGTPEFDSNAQKLAISRLEAKPLQFVGLAIRKFPRMWAPEDYGVSWTVGVTHPSNKDESVTLLLVSQAAYVAILGLAALGLWRLRRARPGTVVVIVVIIGALAVAHTFVEIQPRYHSYVEPLLCIVAGPGVAALRIPKSRTAGTAHSDGAETREGASHPAT